MDRSKIESLEVGHRLSEVTFVLSQMPQFTRDGVVTKIGVDDFDLNSIYMTDSNGVDWCFWTKTLKWFRNDTLEEKFERLEMMLDDAEMF